MKNTVSLLLLITSIQFCQAARIQFDGQAPVKIKTDLAGTPGSTVTSLSGITETRYDAVEGHNSRSGSTQYVYLNNVRAKSSTTTTDDYLGIRYLASNTSLGLTMNQIQIFKGIGVYEPGEGIFIKDVTTAVVMKYGGYTYNADTTYSFNSQTGASPLVFTVPACGSLGLYVGYISGPFKVAITTASAAPADSSYWSVSRSGYANLFSSGLGALSTSNYYLWLKPTSGTTLNYKVTFTNENASITTPVANGQTVSFTQKTNFSNYNKYKITLTAGQDLQVYTPYSSYAAKWMVISDKGVLLASHDTLGGGSFTISLLINCPYTGTYYIVPIGRRTATFKVLP